MSTRLKTSFKLAKSFTPIYTGGSIAVSEDGQRIYTTLNEEVVCTDVASGERIHLFKGDTSVVTTLALSRENATSAGVLAVAHRSLALRFYSLEDFTLARSVARAHDAPITVAVSDPTGSLFATGSADGIVKVWDAKHAHCTHVFRGHGGVVSSLFFDVDTTANATGRKTRPPRLVSASDDCRVRVWALNTRKSLLVLDGHSSVVRGLAVTGDGKTLVSGGRDSVFNVWDLPSGELKSTTPVFETLEAIGIVEVPSTSGDKGRKGKQKATDSGVKSLLWTAGDSGTVKLWDIETGQRITTGDSTAEEDDQGASSSATHEILHTSTNSTSLVTAHVDQNLIFHRLPTMRPFRHMVGFNDEVIDLLYLNSASSSTPSSSSSPETHLAVATNSDLIRVYDLQTFNTTLLPGHADVVLCLARNKAGNVLLSGSKDRTARIWMPSGSDSMQENDGDESAYSSWKCVAVCEGHLGSIGAVTIARREGGYAATASQDKTVKIWDIASLEAGSGDAAPSAPVKAKALATLKVHDKEINSLDISPNDKLLATGSQDRTAKLFAIEYSAPTKARTAPEAKVVPLGIFKGHKRGVWSVKFSPADQVLATASGDRTIKLWSINDFTCLKTFEGHTNTVLRIDYLPAGNQLASCGSDGLVKIWNIKDEEDVATLDNHEDKIWALAANSDASMLVSGGADSVISFWNDVTEQEQEEAIALEEETILRVQDLANYVDAKDYRNAFLLALSMDQPRRLLGLLQSILGDDTDEWSSMLAGVLESLAPGDVFRLLEYVRDWNARSRDSDVAQAVLHSLFRTHSAAQILAAAPGATGLEVADRDAKGSKSVSAGIGDILEALMPYTERHYARADRLEQESAFLDFVLAQMDEYVTEPGTNGMDVDGETVGR